jgi:hypothetical protein
MVRKAKLTRTLQFNNAVRQNCSKKVTTEKDSFLSGQILHFGNFIHANRKLKIGKIIGKIRRNWKKTRKSEVVARVVFKGTAMRCCVSPFFFTLSYSCCILHVVAHNSIPIIEERRDPCECLSCQKITEIMRIALRI